MLLLSLKRVMSSTLFVTAFLALTGITVAQPRVSDNATIYLVTIQQAQPQPRITVDEVTRIKGEFKIPDTGKPTGYAEGLLLVKVTDAKGNAVYETAVENPLDRSIESIDIKGNLTRTRVAIDKDVISLRIPFNTNGHTVSLYSVGAGQRLDLLSVL